MKDDDSSTKGSEFSAKTQTSSQQKMRLGLGRGRPPKPVPSVSDSGLGPSASSQEPSVGDSQSVTSQVADYDSRGDKGTFSEVFTDAEEFLTCTEDEQGERELRFSNINCLFFGELQKNALKVFKYSASFEPTLSTKDRHLFLLKISGRIGDYLLSPPDVLYAAQPIPENLKVVQETIHGESVKLTLTPSDQPLKLEEFFTCLLKRMSLFLTSKEAYIPLNLLTHEKRFEVYPGDAVDVASERECIVRCSTTFNFNVGKVEDIIEECLIYSAMWGEDQSSYHEIVERNLRDLIVHNELNNKSYVVERILWDENLIICRLLKSDTTHRIQPDKLVLVGTRRVPPTARESIKTDKTMSFLGGPASGQRRQLAMVRYKEMMQQDIPSNYLRKWKLHLKDTAVVSNNVLLQSEVLRMQGDANLISSEGWVNRLSNLRVLVPVRVRNWYVIYEKGDERIVKYMIENLRCDAPTIGIEMSEPRRRAITDTSVASYEAILNSCLSQNEKIELFVVVVRANLTDVYNTVKNWSLSQSRPIATQMVLRDTVKQICSVLDTSLSVITQINCKLGGALWALDKTIDNTLVIGLSTYTSADGKDVLGFVSSRNKLFTQWYSYAIMDIDAELCGQLITAVQKYSVENAGQKPERMIVLSNQIADDDFPTRIIKSANAVFNGKLALIHVEDIERYNEIILGLAEQGKLDEIQETQKKYIFVPQRAEKELDMICCRLDFNNTGLSPKDIAGVIKQLKHVYYNVAGEVNLPAPVLYADRCAEFVADVLKGVQSEKIRDKLYYL